MRNILIPTDFSANAMNALKYAAELFKYDICNFFIMHAYQDEIFKDEELIQQETLVKVTQQVSKKSQSNLEKVLKDIKKASPNPRHSFSVISANNMLVDEADKIVDEENIDIVVMGTRGNTNDRKLTFGSHTLQVLRYVQCPVLAIPENYVGIQPRHILFPTNYLIPYKRRELKLLCELAVPYRAIIDMLYVSSSDKLSIRQQNNQSFLKDELCKNQVNIKTVKNENITNAICNYIEENDVDLLVMVNTRHSFFENIFFKSKIDEISLRIDIPFLALQNIRRY
ncbi:universal stress protein [Winogradskyella sp.]|jgi:nucleotide-binding universal stress UspA family protein|uniref:universal stress protein n=1 Tax=Winogradskyella sp. TaxID=1883156 RepID=UPI0025F54339|nr:universal stress protein [Winogradskyella sp.]MCT4628901.1 universal stress protein [Winogradskyella sp.]